MRKRNQPENHDTIKKRPCTTTLKMNLLSSLVLSCLQLSCLVLSCLVLSSLVFSCPLLSCLLLSCRSSSVFSSLSVPVFFLCLCLSLSLSPCGVCAWCPLNTSPCVRSKRRRVYRHHAHTLKHVCAWCRYKRGRFERTHGEVFHR